MNIKAKQVLNYTPSEEMLRCFNEDADGFSHSFSYCPEKDKIFFSALTSNCGIIQVYADSTDEMEKEFIKRVRERLEL